MSITWEEALQDYRSHHFRVFTREQILSTPPEILTAELPASTAVLAFMQQLAQPQLSLREAFVTAVQSFDESMHPNGIFAPLIELLDRAMHVAIMYGEHFVWKSPDQWSYLFMVENGVKSADGSDASAFFVVHPPATRTHIQQAEAVIGVPFPPTYMQLLQMTNGLGLDLNELAFICGAGNARAAWDKAELFEAGNFLRDTYQEIASYWFAWQDVLAYERQRDRETGIDTFRSDERKYIPFAYTYDEWCFDRTNPDERGEYPVYFWDHELREATYKYPNFEAWFVDVAILGN